MSRKNEYFLKCQGNVREFYKFQLVSNNEKQKMSRAVFLTFWLQAKSFYSFYIALNIRRWKDMASFASSAAFFSIADRAEGSEILVWELSGIPHPYISSSLIPLSLSVHIFKEVYL